MVRNLLHQAAPLRREVLLLAPLIGYSFTSFFSRPMMRLIICLNSVGTAMTKQDLVDHIRDLSEHMLTVANLMQYYAGFHEELYDAGTQLLGASHIAKTWADELESNK